MNIYIPLPIGWFTNAVSKRICIENDLRVIRAVDWVLFEILLMQTTRLPTSLVSVSFSDGTILFHPDGAIPVIKRNLRKIIKGALND